MANINILDILTPRNIKALSRVENQGLLNLENDTDALLTLDMLVSEVLDAIRASQALVSTARKNIEQPSIIH